MEKECTFCPISENELKNVMDFNPIEKLGQNFLVDPTMVKKLINQTILEADVVEIGIGPGNITKGIAQRAEKVIGLEIFPGFTEAQNFF